MLVEIIGWELSRVSPVRPVIAAELLGLSEPSVRAWVAAGVLATVEATGRVLLDPVRLLRMVDHVRQSVAGA